MVAIEGLVTPYWPSVVAESCPNCGSWCLSRDEPGVYVCIDYDDYGLTDPGCGARFRFSRPETITSDLDIGTRASATARSMAVWLRER